MAAAIMFAAAAPAAAGRLEAKFTDQKGEPVEDAVVVAAVRSGQKPPLRPQPAIVDQIDKTFVPHVLPVVVGTKINFPNRDDIRHHLYSFSDAKSFELPLYKGTPAEPILFDEPGVVVLGCNIHDFMRGYVYVVESPYYAVSGEDGVATIDDLPAGSYEVTVWHPREKEAAKAETVEVAAAGAASLAFELQLKPQLKIRRAPTARTRRY